MLFFHDYFGWTLHWNSGCYGRWQASTSSSSESSQARMKVPGITGRQVHYAEEHDIRLQHKYWEKHPVKKKQFQETEVLMNSKVYLLKAVPSQRELLCEKRFLLQTSAQQSCYEQKGHHHSSPPREALSCGRPFMEKDIFITLSINNNKYQNQCKRHPPSREVSFISWQGCWRPRK